MKIKEVKTAFKIMDAVLNNDNTISFNYLDEIYDENNQLLDNTILTTNYARVYLIVVNGVIKKIGGSEAEGGIKSTLSIYKDGGVKGRPSIRSFGIYYLILEALKAGKKIEFYMIYQENFEKEIKGLFGLNKVKDAYISYKLIEHCCISDYLSKENNEFPEWNVQEQGMDWPDEIKEEHSNITMNNKSNRKKIKFKNK
jgi:hypothetical protein